MKWVLILVMLVAIGGSRTIRDELDQHQKDPVEYPPEEIENNSESEEQIVDKEMEKWDEPKDVIEDEVQKQDWVETPIMPEQENHDEDASEHDDSQYEDGPEIEKQDELDRFFPA